jgi:hypothetical protein
MTALTFKSHRDMSAKVDNASGTLTSIGAYCSQQALAHAIDMLDVTGMGRTLQHFQPGLGKLEITLNGYINTTTDGIFTPLVSTNTSMSKTVEFQVYAGRYVNSEFWVSSVDVSGSRDSLETWSAKFALATTVINRTSVAL